MAHSDFGDALALLLSLQHRNILLRTEGEELLCDAPEGVLTQGLTARILSHKAGLMHLLNSMEQDGNLPRVKAVPNTLHAPFPMTENQEAYWLGRESQESGGVGVHVFFELEFWELDKARLQNAWNAVVQRHAMLRVVALPEGKQRILPVNEEIHIEEEFLAVEGGEDELALARQELSHRCYNLFAWPQFTLKVFHLPDAEGKRKSILMFSLDAWALDLRSLQIILDDLVAFYNRHTPLPLPQVSFRDYVAALQELHVSVAYEKALAYWHKRIRTLPPAPLLPLRQQTESAQTAHFTRRSRRLDKALWNRISDVIKSKGLSTASVLLACYASVLSKWSETKHFTLNIPRYNRLPMHDEISNIVGQFTSFSLLEVDNRASMRFEDFARQIQNQLWADLEHTHVSGVRVLRDWKNFLGSAPTVMAPFVFTDEPEYYSEESSPTGMGQEKRSWIGAMERLGTMRNIVTQTPQVWIDSQYTEVSGQLYVSWDSLDNMFEEGLPDSMFEAYCALVESLGTEDAWLREGVPLPSGEAPLQRLLVGPLESLPQITPWEAVRERAQTSPEKLAIVDAAGIMTWRQVRDAVQSLVEMFRRLGLPSGEVFAFALSKGRNQFIASMAIHAFGGIVVPLDHESPRARLQTILTECHAAVLLTDSVAYSRLSTLPVPVLNLDMPEVPLTLPVPFASGHFDASLYCMIFTSGSTGVPKGVMMPLHGLLNMAQDAGKRFALGEDDAILCLNPIYHDFSLFDVMGAALLGMPLIFPDPARLKDPGHWLNLMREYHVSVWATVPATMTMLLDYWDSCDGGAPLTDLRFAIQGGDWIPLHTPVRLRDMAPNAKVVSIGGPTEVSVWNLLYPVQEMDGQWRSIPYGLPIRNATYHILDEKLEDCPAMVAGELYCSGVGLTAGYANDVQKTSAAFFVHPTKNIRMFKTGDLGRLHHKGYIEFIGRRDNQVNINGYRIELGEIEAAAGRHLSVSQAVAVAAKGPGRVDVLAVWAVCKPGFCVTAQELKEHLREHLPKYMLPPYVSIVAGLPLTQNNKIDRITIAQWELPDSGTGGEGELPGTSIEQELAAAWRELLGRETVYLDQNFFEIGGNSISAVRLYKQVMAGRFNELSVATIFSCPTLRSLSKAMEAAGERIPADDAAGESSEAQRGAHAWPELTPIPFRSATAPATRGQMRIFYQDREMRDNGSFNLSMRVAVRGEHGLSLDPEQLRRAFNTVVAHHEILRTTFRTTAEAENVGKRLVEQHVARNLELSMEIRDVSGQDEAAQKESVERFCREFTQRPYSLENGPLVRLAFVLTGSGQGSLIIGFHHIVLDGWSMALLLDDVVAALGGTALSANTLQQADVAVWENSHGFVQTVESLLPAAVERLARYESPSVLPDAFSLSEEKRSSMEAESVVDEHFPAEVMDAVSSMCSQTGCTPFAVFFTVFGLLAAEYNGADSAQVGTYVAARTLSGMDQVLGSMVSPTPVLLSFDKRTPFLSMVKETMRVVSQGIDTALLPFEDLVRLAAPVRTGGHPFFGMAFSYENTPTREYAVSGMKLTPQGILQYRTSIDFEAAVAFGETHGRMCIVFNPDKVSKKVTEDFIRRFFILLEQVVRQPECPLGDLNCMTPLDERAIALWNGSPVRVPEGETLCGLFREMVTENPEGTAVVEVSVVGDTPRELARYTFGELSLLADSMAQAMLSRGVEPGRHIALPVGRSARLIAGLIAAQQCGAIVTPIPVSTPKQQLRDILEALAPCLVCCESAQEAELTEYGQELFFLDTVPLLSADALRQFYAAEGGRSLSATTDACVIFTSGSEGKPKGVRLTHANWLHRLHAGWAALPFQSDEACLFKASIGFVDAFSEIFQPLLRGVPLFVVPEWEGGNVEAIAQHLKYWKITRLTAVASLVQALVDQCRSRDSSLPFLKTVVATGELLPRGVVKRFYEIQPRAVLHNSYGSTEMTGDVVCGPVVWGNDFPNASVPIGRPMGNATVLVVSPTYAPLPAGMPGQIAVAGPSLSPGYVDGDSSRFFILNNERYLASGDLGMWTDSGELLCFGRLDRQIKIRGHRIEVGGVEESIRSTGMVADVAVVAVGKESEQMLAACYVPAGDMTTRDVTPEDLRAAVRPLLNQAALPSIFKEVAAIPKNRNGKTDVRALQALVDTFVAEGNSVVWEFQNETETLLAEIWKTLTGHAVPVRNADFFVCGGHSLSAARLTALLRETFRVSLRVKDIFDTPQFADQAELIDLLILTSQDDSILSDSSAVGVTV